MPDTPLFVDTVLGHAFCESEKGNVWLYNEELTAHNLWIALQPEHWLEIAYRAENYPAWTIQTARTTEESLARHILLHCGGMKIGKLNLNSEQLVGVEGEIPEPAEDTEDG